MMRVFFKCIYVLVCHSESMANEYVIEAITKFIVQIYFSIKFLKRTKVVNLFCFL